MTKPPNSSWNPRGESTEKGKRRSRRWDSARGTREAGRNLPDLSDVFIGLGWCRKVTWKRATRSEASSFHHNHQPSHTNHEPWSEKKYFLFNVLFFFFLAKHELRELHKNQDQEKIGKSKERKRNWSFPSSLYLHSALSLVKVASEKIENTQIISREQPRRSFTPRQCCTLPFLRFVVLLCSLFLEILFF